MKALYVTGATPINDVRPARRLTQVAPDLTMTYVLSVADALVEVRKTSGYQVLFTDPSLPQNETLALITSLRRDRVPLALVPVVSEEQRDFLASAVAAGADDVLLLQGETVLHAAGQLLRIRHSPHLLPAENRPRLRLLYAGRDQLVWALLEQIPFIKPERAMLGADGSCVVRIPGADTGRLRCDVVLIDEQPGEAHPLQVVKSVKSQASDVPVVVLTAANDLHTATAALDLGADEAVSKAGIYRRRLISTLRRLHQRVEMEALHSNVSARENRLRNIVERLPAAVAVISDDGRVLAVNNTALAVLGAKQPSDLVGREFHTLVVSTDRAQIEQSFEAIRRGQDGNVRTVIARESGDGRTVDLRGVLLERDARGGRGVVIVIQPVDLPVAAPLVETEVEPAAEPTVEADTAELDAARAQAAETARRVEELELAHQEAQAEHEAAVADFARERAEWDQARRDFEERLAALGSENRENQAAIEHERGQVEEAHQLRAAAVAVAMAESNERRSVLETRIADLEPIEREFAELRAAHEDVRAREQRALEELAGARAAAEQERAAAVAASGVEADWARERDEWERQRAAFERELHEREQDREAAHRSHDEREREREHWQRERDGWQSEREGLVHEREARRHERDDLQREREALLHDRERVRGEWDAERCDLRAHIVDLEREISELSALRGMLDAARQQHEQLAQELAATHATANRERETASHTHAAVEQERARAASIEQALQQARTDFAQQLAALELAHGRARDEWDEERTRIADDLQRATTALESERADREAQAHASQSQLVSGGRFGSVVATRAGVVVRANDAFGRLLGYTDASDLTNKTAGQPIAGLVLRGFDETRDTTGAPVRVSFALDRQEGGTLHGVGAVRRLDEWRDGEPLFEHMILSVSRELDLEDRLRQARRLEAVGSLATSMVPELESLIAQWMRGGGDVHDAQQAAEAIGQLAAFSRHQSGVAGTVDLADVVRRLQSLVEQLAGPQHQVRVDLRRAPVSDVSETELAQLVTALVVTGRDLLPAGGAIALSTDIEDEMGTYVATDAAPVRRPRQARLRVAVRGYGLRAYAASEALDALVARCSATIAVEPTGPRALLMTVTLPGGR